MSWSGFGGMGGGVLGWKKVEWHPTGHLMHRNLFPNAATRQMGCSVSMPWFMLRSWPQLYLPRVTFFYPASVPNEAPKRAINLSNAFWFILKFYFNFSQPFVLLLYRVLVSVFVCLNSHIYAFLRVQLWWWWFIPQNFFTWDDLISSPSTWWRKYEFSLSFKLMPSFLLSLFLHLPLLAWPFSLPCSDKHTYHAFLQKFGWHAP